MKIRTFLFAVGLGAAAPALADPPEGVATMIAEAAETGDPKKLDTVVGIARAAFPGEGDAIAALDVAGRERIAQIMSARAQAAEAEMRAASVFENWAGRGELGGFYATGSTEETGVTAGLDLARIGIDWRHLVTAHVDWRSSAGTTTREQLLLGYEPNYDLDERLFLYGLVQAEMDRFQGVDNRISLSGGAGYRIFDQPGIQLAVKGGPAWRRTNRVDAPTTERLAGLAALTLDWTIAEGFGLTQDADAYLQSSNSTYRSETGLEAGLGRNLIARLAYRVEHEGNPPLGSEATDTLTRFTIVYDFE